MISAHHRRLVFPPTPSSPCPSCPVVKTESGFTMNCFQSRSGFQKFLAFVLLAAIFPSGLFAEDLPTSTGEDALYQHAAVAADHPLASQAGLEILQKGGNVVDAAVATSFALSVVRPESCGIGGGGFMVLWNAKTQKAVALDYREIAPKAASREMYLNARKANPKNPMPSQNGALAVAVPGHVAGLCYALETYGTLD